MKTFFYIEKSIKKRLTVKQRLRKNKRRRKRHQAREQNNIRNILQKRRMRKRGRVERQRITKEWLSVQTQKVKPMKSYDTARRWQLLSVEKQLNYFEEIMAGNDKEAMEETIEFQGEVKEGQEATTTMDLGENITESNFLKNIIDKFINWDLYEKDEENKMEPSEDKESQLVTAKFYN